MELRLATAEKAAGKWRVDVIPESNISEANLPSSKVFKDFRRSLLDGNKNCVFFIHDFNQTFLKNLNKCAKLNDTALTLLPSPGPPIQAASNPRNIEKPGGSWN